MKSMKALVFLVVVILVAAWLPMAVMADNETAPAEGTTVPEAADNYCGDNVTWRYENGVLTFSGTGTTYDYHKKDRPWDEYRLAITKVVIENGITVIGGNLCSNFDNMREVSIPSSVKTIDIYAFAHCKSLTSVVIPNSVTTIELCAFTNCPSLKNVVLPNKLSTLSDSTFWQCSSLQEITIPASVKNIEGSVFESCHSLKKVTFLGDAPNTSPFAFYEVTATCYYPGGNPTWTEEAMAKIGVEANLTWVAVEPELKGSCGDNASWRLEDGVLTISGTGAMYDYHYDDVPWDDHKDEVTKVVVEKGVTHIGEDAFESLHNLKSVSIANTVKSIGCYAFSDCTSLASIVLPNSVTSMDLCVFIHCASLKNVTLPSGLSTLPRTTFVECPSLQEITIPASVTYIEQEAFRDCPALKKITFLGDAPDFFYPFRGITATCYYPGNNPTWTEEVREAMGDGEENSITWVAVNPEPQPTEPKPTEPKPTEPKPTEPKPTEPKPTEPKPTEPKPTTPKPTEPKPTDHVTTEPSVAPDETVPADTTVPETTVEVTEPVDTTEAVEEPQDDGTAPAPSDTITISPSEETKPGNHGGIIAVICLAVLALAGGAAGFIYMKKRRV